jgi:hypothetical protein
VAPGSIQRRALATVAVLAALLVGAATLRAVGWKATGAPQVHAAATGSMALTSSAQEGAIFTLDEIGPGDTGAGEVTIANSGTLPGTLTLASADLDDARGRYGGRLSERLQLQLLELGADAPAEVYSGGLAAMPELQLGDVPVGSSRTYRFRVTMLDGGAPASPFVDDNLFQRATATIAYEWTLTESEGGEPEPEPGPEPAPPGQPTPAPGAPRPSPSAPASPSPSQPPPTPQPAGTPRADVLLGSAGDDTLRGLGGADRIYGRGGRDRLDGGPGRDRIFGGPGADRLRGGPGADLLDCGPGRDLAQVDARDRVRGCERVRGPRPASR